MTRARGWIVVVALVVGLPGIAAADQVLDTFDDVSGWTADASPGATITLAQDAGHAGGALRVDFDFHGAGGYVLVHKDFSLTLPPNYAFKFDMRGTAPPNAVEFKLVDPAGNVWWNRRRDFTFPADWQQMVVKRSGLRLAWGPAGGGWPSTISAIEMALTPPTGGAGTVWIDDLRLEEREPLEKDGWRPKVTASSAVAGHEPQRAADDDPDTNWRSDGDGEQWVLLDLLKHREFGGLVIDWDPEAYAVRYRVEVSDDTKTWIAAYANTTGSGSRDYVYMPDAEWRYVRLALEESNGAVAYGIREITVKPPAFSDSVNDFFAAIAADTPPGTFPKYLLGKQSYWTVVGARDDTKEALVNEEGQIEVDTRAFSIEPFLYTNGQLITWNDAQIAQELAQGTSPVPTVLWRHDALRLRTTAWAAGPAGASVLYVRYRVENTAETPQEVKLYVAVRPFQVLPPWQSLNILGGVSPIHVLDFDGRAVHVDGGRAVVSLTPPARFGAASFAQSLTSKYLRRGEVPPETHVSDPFGYASGALEYPLKIAGGGSTEVHVAVPFHDPTGMAAAAASEPNAFESISTRTVSEWAARLSRVELQVPPMAAKLVDTLKTTIAYMLINRDGPAIQPGSRTYARSWIRDGALTATALLQTGSTEEAREFLQWYAQFQLPDGRIPCCVDQRGADPVPEYDSDGEFIFTVAEYYRFTHDVGFVQEMWPTVIRALDSIAALRAKSTTEEYTRPEKEAFYGLMPASISHEGYSSHPVHSYWDDFFALRGLKDGAMLASVVGDDERATGVATLRDEFRADLYASIDKTMARHQIDYIPGSVELGDFDPTSTAIAVTICGELEQLPQPALTRTFDRYYQHVQDYLHGMQGDGYSPYELRNVEVFVRLGWRDRTNDLLAGLMADQRPSAWNEWQEIVWRDASAPRFIGDMPHTWVGAGFVHSLRSLFAYERESDRSLVLGAGIPWEWLAAEGGVAVKRLPTHYGVLSYTLRAEGPDSVRMRLSGDLGVPPATIVLEPPLPSPLKAMRVNGKAVTSFQGERATVNEFPADVVLEY